MLKAYLVFANAVRAEFRAQDTQRFLSKRIDASGLSTAQRERISADINDAAFFSSKVSDAKLLERMQDYIARAARGESGFYRNGFISKMKSVLPGAQSETTASRGALTELSSSRRLGLIFDFQRERMNAEVFLAQGENPDHAWLYPALELIRESRRNVPRNWRERWIDAGGKLYAGRMIALRDDPIWRKISRFGSPTPPFDFNSGMGLEEVSRTEAERLGLIKPGESDGEALPEPIRKNTSAVAKFLGIVQEKPMTFEKADGLRANPSYKTGRKEYRVNCQSCVVANELRRRGLDIKAAPYTGQGLQKTLARGEASAAWRTADGAVPKETETGKIPLLKSKRTVLEEATPDIGRYFVTVFMSKTKGHIFTAERLADGTLRLYDPQSGEVADGKKELSFFGKISRKYGFRVLRVDNLVIASDTLGNKRRMSLDAVIRESRER
jgi:hypothetical protein